MTDLVKRRGLIGLAVFLLSLTPALTPALTPVQAAADFCDPDRVELRGEWGQAAFQVELADEPSERQRGLMFRHEMPLSAGMLFAYEREQPAVFWMRNTYLPLDLIFTDSAGVVQHVHHNAVPLDETLIHGGEAIQYVLEVNAGVAARLRIDVGTQMRHPAITEALWPCE